MPLVIDVLSWGLLIAGSAFCLIGGIGLIRMPGFYSRAHASGLIDSLGAALILVGLALQSGFSDVTTKLIAILIILWITSPTAAHALVNAAYTQGFEPITVDDDSSTP
jgi:multicomponent Na+:H+ antiporter subunit G